MNRRRLRIHQRAIQDIDAIAEHIAAHDLDAAIRFIASVRREFEMLTLFSGIGTIREEAPERLRGLRSLPLRKYRNYLIFYFVSGPGHPDSGRPAKP